MPPARPQEGKSDKKGEATFKRLDAGVYRVVGRKEGLEPTYREPVRLQPGKEETITLELKPGDVAKKFYFEDPALIQQANQLFQEGINAYQQEKFAETVSKLSESLKIVPYNPDGHFWLGVTLIRQRRWDEGQKEIETAVAMRPEEQRFQEILRVLPAARLGDEGQEAMQRRDFKLAITKFSEQLKLQPDNADVCYNLALAYANDRQFDKAIEYLDEAIKRKPDDTSYPQLKALVLQHKEQALIQEANRILSEGDKLFKEEQYQAALEKYQAGLKMLPKEEPIVWLAIGRCHAGLKHPDEAAAAFQKAISLDPKKAEYSQALASLYVEQKRIPDAIRVYEAFSQQSGQPVEEQLFELGKSLLTNSNPDGVPILQRVLEMNPNHAESYYELGVYTFYSVDKQKAKPLLIKYTEIGKDQKHIEDAKALLAVLSQPAPAPPQPKRRRP